MFIFLSKKVTRFLNLVTFRQLWYIYNRLLSCFYIEGEEMVLSKKIISGGWKMRFGNKKSWNVVPPPITAHRPYTHQTAINGCTLESTPRDVYTALLQSNEHFYVSTKSSPTVVVLASSVYIVYDKSLFLYKAKTKFYFTGLLLWLYCSIIRCLEYVFLHRYTTRLSQQ